MTFKRQWLVLPRPIALDYNVPSGTLCVQVRIPDDLEHLALLQGLMARLTVAENWQGDAADTVPLAARWQQAYIDTDWSNCLNVDQSADNSLIIFADNFAVDTGNALQITISNTQRHNFYVRQNPSILGQITEVERYLTNGTWNYRLTGVKSTNSGISIMQVVDPDSTITTVFTQDFYQAGGLANFTLTGTFTINEPGRTKFSFGTTGKHTSSTGYDLLLTCLELWR